MIRSGSERARASSLRRSRNALILANKYLASDTGTALLAKTREADPTDTPVLGDFGDNWVMPAIARASTLGEVDHFDYLPWTARRTSGSRPPQATSSPTGRREWPGRARDPRSSASEGDPSFAAPGRGPPALVDIPISMLAAGTPEAESISWPSTSSTGRCRSWPCPTAGRPGRPSQRCRTWSAPAPTQLEVRRGGRRPRTGGFSAAVNAASEGMRVILINATFSQASSSPMIRNYLGFPEGVTGAELMRRAWKQDDVRVSSLGSVRAATASATAVTTSSSSTTAAEGTAMSSCWRSAWTIALDVPSVDRLSVAAFLTASALRTPMALPSRRCGRRRRRNSAVQAAITRCTPRPGGPPVVRGNTSRCETTTYRPGGCAAKCDGPPEHVRSPRRRTRNSSAPLALRDRCSAGRLLSSRLPDYSSRIGAVPRTDWSVRAALRHDLFVVTGRGWSNRTISASVRNGRCPQYLPRCSGSVKRVAAAVGEGSGGRRESAPARGTRAAEARTTG